MPSRFLNNITVNDEYTLPSADGTADQIITTDGAGQLSFVDQSTVVSGASRTVSILVKNISSSDGGVNLSKGDPVYIYGSVGASERLYVDLADAGDSSKMPCVALLDQNLSPNGEGTATVTGKLKNLITSPIDGATPTENDTIYVKSGGGLTLTKPTGVSNLIQNVGQVGRVSTSSDGNIVVSAILRSNDVPNLSTGKIWVGDGNTVESTVVHLDETNSRMGIGTSSPGATFHVSGGAIRIDDSQQLQFGNGSVRINNDASGRMYLRAPLAYYFEGNGGYKMVLDGNSGNVGIGTTSPENILHLKSANPHLILEDTSNPNKNKIENVDGNMRYHADYNSQMGNSRHIFYIDNSEKLRINTNGNVGIGTTSPAKKLTIGDIGIGNTDGLKIEDPSATNYGAHYSYNDGSTTVEIGGVVNNALRDCISIARDATRTITINTSEYVGIGTTSPQAKLHVANGTLRTWAPTSGTSAIFESTVGNRNFVTLTAANEAELWFGNASTQTLGRIRYEMAGNNMEFWTNATQKMVIDSSGNVGIGTTSPSEKLHVYNGKAYVTPIPYAANQSAYALKIGAYNSTSFDMGLQAKSSSGGSPYMSFRTTTADDVLVMRGGNVGIGTTSPASHLGSTKVLDISSTGNGEIILDHTDAGTSSDIGLYSWNRNNDHLAHVKASCDGTTDSAFISFHAQPTGGSFSSAGSNEKMRIKSNGNVGIGETNPAQKLHVIGNSEITGDIFLGRYIFHNDDNNTWLGFPTSDTISFRTNGSDRMYINSSGNVGIGTTSPGDKLHVEGTVRADSPATSGWAFQGRNNLNTALSGIWFDNGDGELLLRDDANNLNVRLRSDSDSYFNGGNVGIGAASPTSRFHVKQTLASPSVPMVYFEADRGSSAYGTVNVRVDNLDYGTGMKFVKSGTFDSNAVAFYNGLSSVGGISINTSSTSYNTTSDYRLKENLSEITDGIDRIKQLKPKRFNFIGDTTVVDGFIAHEAKQVVPEAVTGEKDEVLPNGDPVYQGIDQSKIVPLLTAALQEAITKIEVLENRLQTLENK